MNWKENIVKTFRCFRKKSLKRLLIISLSVHVEGFVSDWMNFPDALRRWILLKPVGVTQFWLRADKNNWQFLYIYISLSLRPVGESILRLPWERSHGHQIHWFHSSSLSKQNDTTVSQFKLYSRVGTTHCFRLCLFTVATSHANFASKV